jgi:type IV pilus assembly protein PilM
LFAFLRGKQSCYLGLDINSDEIRLLQLTRKATTFTIQNYAVATLPAGAIMAGKIEQPVVLQQVLARLVRETRTQNCATAIALPGNAVISQQISLPANLSALDCEATISTNLPRYFPGITDELCFDFLPLATTDASKQQILLVASRLWQITSYVSLIKAAGLRVNIVDVDKFALMRAARLTTAVYAETDIVAIVHISRQHAELIIFCHQTILFNQLWQLDDKQPLLASIKHAWQLYSSVKKPSQKSVDYVMLSGKASPHFATLTTYFTDELTLTVVPANPFQQMLVAATVNTNSLEQEVANFQICCGLATRSFNHAGN